MSTGAVLCVQAVVEEVSMAGIDTVQADVVLCFDATPQVMAAARELKRVKIIARLSNPDTQKHHSQKPLLETLTHGKKMGIWESC